MLTVSNVQTSGWQAAIRGMRNPMNSWAKSDSDWEVYDTNPNSTEFTTLKAGYALGPNDLDLATRLIKAGPEHAKFLRMIHVQMDINGPLYWWKEMDTYKVGTAANSCSTMHKIAAKEFTLEDFSCEHLISNNKTIWSGEIGNSMECLDIVISTLNYYREYYLSMKEQNVCGANEKAKEIWWQLIQLLPSSYNQLRTWDASLATVLSICKQRKGHKLDEWETFRQVCFANIPYFNEFYNAMGGNN